MRPEIHPEYKEIKATCSCGNIIVINSTLKEDINLDVCSSCHPFYTGKQKLVDTGGRVERFEKRFGKKGKSKIKAEAPEEVREETSALKESEKKVPEKKATTKKATTKKSTSKKASKKEEKLVEEPKEK